MVDPTSSLRQFLLVLFLLCVIRAKVGRCCAGHTSLDIFISLSRPIVEHTQNPAILVPNFYLTSGTVVRSRRPIINWLGLTAVAEIGVAR